MILVLKTKGQYCCPRNTRLRTLNPQKNCEAASLLLRHPSPSREVSFILPASQKPEPEPAYKPLVRIPSGRSFRFTSAAPSCRIHIHLDWMTAEDVPVWAGEDDQRGVMVGLHCYICRDDGVCWFQAPALTGRYLRMVDTLQMSCTEAINSRPPGSMTAKRSPWRTLSYLIKHSSLLFTPRLSLFANHFLHIGWRALQKLGEVHIF